MIRISAAEFQDEVLPGRPLHPENAVGGRYFRGRIDCGMYATRFTLRTFESRDEAELYALKIMLRVSTLRLKPTPCVAR